MKFNLPFHQKIFLILESLNVSTFEKNDICFGGGTQLALRFGEYRWSKDIDFICSAGKGYKALRALISTKEYAAIFSTTSDFELPRDIKADQYGIRFPVKIDDEIIKFEIILEGRIALTAPDKLDWCKVPCLSISDAFTEKLLSNADRWNDSSIESRDLIDLSVLRFYNSMTKFAIDKANEAYETVVPLKNAISTFQSDPQYRERCYKSLRVSNPTQIVDGLDLLAKDFGLSPTKRSSLEASLTQHVYLKGE